MNDRKQTNIERINEVWDLHQPRDEEMGIEGRCLAFVIDRRYIEQDGIEMRLGISFGTPVVGPETEQGFLPIPVVPGEVVFGLHLIGIRDNRMSVFDSWMDSIEAGGCTDAAEAEKKARTILDSKSDEEYAALVHASPDDKRPLQVSER